MNRPDGTGFQAPALLKEQCFELHCRYEKTGGNGSKEGKSLRVFIVAEDSFFDECEEVRVELQHRKKCDTNPEYLPRLARKAKYEIVREHQHINPRGGEQGTDGYIDAEYRNVESGVVTRFISKDIFDFGCFHFPYRVGGTQEVRNPEGWTEEERGVKEWLGEFSPFHGIRM